MTQTHMLMQKLRKLVKKYGGVVELDGCGGYNAIAPNGKLWTNGECNCQPIPLNEAESNEEKEDMVRTAIDIVKEGCD